MSSLNIETCESLAKSLTEEKVSLPWFCEDLFKVTNDIINALNPTAPEHAEAFLSLKRHVLETDQLALAIKILDICFRGTLPPSMTTSSLEHVCPDARLENTDAEYLLNFRDEIATKLITSTGEILTPILNKLAGHPFNRSLRRHMLVQAIKSSEKEKVLLLIDKAQHPRKMGLVAFFHAASLGNLELVQTLLVKTQPSDNHKIKALIQAVRAKQEETGLFLLGQIQGPISEESQTEILKQSIPQSLTRFTIAFSEQYPLSPGMYLHAENSWWESQETNLLLSHIKRSPQGPGSAQRLNSKHPLSLMLQEALATKDPEKLNRAFDELKKENRIPSCIVQNKIQEKQNIRFTLQNIFNRPDFQEILPLVFSDRTLWMDATYTGLWPEFYQIFSQTHLLTTQDPHMLNILRWVLTKPAQLSNLMRIVFSLNQHTAMSQIIPEYPRLQELIDNLNHLDPLDFIKTTNYSPMHLGIALIIAAQTNNPEAVQTLLLPATNIEQIYLDAALRATRSIEMVQVLLPNHSFSPSVLHSTIGWIVENEPDQRNASLLSLFLDAGLDDEGLNIFFESLTSPESQQLNFSLFYNFIKQKDTDSWMGNLQKYKEEISNCLWNNSLDLIWRYQKETDGINKISRLFNTTSYSYDPVWYLADKGFLESSDLPVWKFLISLITQINEKELSSVICSLINAGEAGTENVLLQERLSSIDDLMKTYKRCLDAENAAKTSSAEKDTDEIPTKRVKIEILELSGLIGIDSLEEIIHAAIDRKLPELLDYFVF